MRKLEHPTLSFVESVRNWCGPSFAYTGPASEEEIAAAELELGVVFPRSYRAFLRHFGCGTRPYKIYGLPGNGLWGDVVMMNQLSSCWMPAHYIKFTDRRGECSYYLDASQMDDEGECPVVEFGPGEEGTVVADSFLDFLRKTSASFYLITIGPVN